MSQTEAESVVKALISLLILTNIIWIPIAYYRLFVRGMEFYDIRELIWIVGCVWNGLAIGVTSVILFSRYIL
jgi:hypothetical protein